jgi:putative ABC transport system permease protein
VICGAPEATMRWLPLDLRDAFRSLALNPSFSLVLLVTLGLGIGATTTIYSFVYALLLRPYEYADPNRLVRVQSVYTKEGGVRRGASLRDIEDYRRRATHLADIGAYTSFETRLLTDSSPDVISTSQLNSQALSLLGVKPILGRLLLPEEDVPGGDVFKALISHNLWLARFGGDPRIVGKPLRTDRQTYTVVGVMPPGFGFPDRTAVWTPMEAFYARLPPKDDRREKWRGGRWYMTIARLQPGVTLAQAEADLNSVAAALEREFPKENDGVRVKLTDFREFETGPLRPYLLVSLGGVGLVLLICCVNVANLLLVRAASRQREVSVKLALGANVWRVARGLIVESLTLGFAGGALGILFALVGVRGVLALIPARLPTWMQIDVDLPVQLFSMAIGLLAAILFGLAPIAAASRVDLTKTLREGSRGSARGRIRSVLVVAEIALSVVLLVGAGLMVKTFLRLHQRNPGFQDDGVVAARVVAWAPGVRRESAAILANLHNRVLSALTALPGVSTAAVSNSVPYGGTSSERMRADVFIRGRSEQETKTLVPIAGADISVDYFRTLRIPLVHGRLFDATDTTASEPVIIVSDRAARLFWPRQDPIGQYITWGRPTEQNPWTRVVGVVGNVRHNKAEGDDGVEFYYPLTQWPVSTTCYVVRTSQDPDTTLDGIRRAILATEPTLAVSSVQTLERRLAESLWQRRLWGVLFTAFSVLALALAAVGVYGVVSYAVAQRTREIGIRMALGAAPASVRGLVVREGMLLCGGGLALGIAGAFVLGRFAAGLLFGVTPYDGSTYLSVVFTILGIGLLACWLPATRASRVDPSIVLRDA